MSNKELYTVYMRNISGEHFFELVDSAGKTVSVKLRKTANVGLDFDEVQWVTDNLPDGKEVTFDFGVSK
jgi:hypothetical protein